MILDEALLLVQLMPRDRGLGLAIRPARLASPGVSSSKTLAASTARALKQCCHQRSRALVIRHLSDHGAFDFPHFCRTALVPSPSWSWLKIDSPWSGLHVSFCSTNILTPFS